MPAAAKAALKEKLFNIYTEVEGVEKKGHNSSQNYDYIKATDVTAAIRTALIKQRVYAEINFDFEGLPYFIERKSGPPMAAVNVKCLAVFHDLDSNETLSGSGLGSGSDSGDKAVYKAQTGALKYALKNSFLLKDDGTSDPEAPETPEEAPDFQDARHSTQRAPQAQPASRPTQVASGVPLPSEARSTPPAASTETVKPADAPSTTSAAPGAGREPGDDTEETMPTETELAVYRKSFSKLADELTTEGKLKASRGLPVNRKVLVFLLGFTKADDATKITKAKWDSFFKKVEATKASEAGLVGLALKVNEANGITETPKK